MIKLIYLVFILLFCFSGCSEKPSVFTKKIEKDTGSISVINTSSFLGAVTVGNALDHEIIIKATGGLDLFNINVALSTNDDFSFLDGTYPGTGGNCGATLKSGETCKIVVRFGPTKISAQSAQFNFSFSDSLSQRIYSYLLTADSHPILTFEYGSSYDFGNKFIGSTTDLKIKISNSGRVVAQNITINNMSAPFSFKGGSYPGLGGDCGIALTPGQNCSIIITYSPVSRGQHLQDIVLNYLNNGRTEGNSLNLLAWGFSAAVLTISAPGEDAFGTVANGNAHTKTYTVTHSGGDVAANLLTVAGLTAPFSRAGGTCTTVLSIDQHTCTIIVEINSAISSDWNSSFNFSYFNGIQAVTVNKTLSASTRQKPVLSFSISGTLDFGVVKRNTSGSATITVTYASGEIPATNLNFSNLSAPFSYSGASTCGSVLSFGTCTKIVTFSPIGDYKPPLTLPILQASYSDTIATVNASPISLKGSSNALITNNPSGSFGSVVTGQKKDLSITFYNYSGTSALNISARPNPSGFTFKDGNYPGTGGTCGTSFLPAAAGSTVSTCTIVLQFSPILEQPYNGNFVIDYNNGVEDTTYTLALSGTGAPAALLSVEDKSFLTTGLNSEMPSATLVKVTNTGSVNATALSLLLPSGFIRSTLTVPGYNLCTTTLAGNSSCYLNIIFNPKIAKIYTETATLNYNNGAVTTSTSFLLNGTAEDRAELYLSKYNLVSFSFTYVGSSQTTSIQLGHGGGATYATDIALSTTTADFTVESSTCGSSMFNAEICSISIRFAPLSSGNKTGQLNVSYRVNGVDKFESRNLAGTANHPGLLTFSPSSWDFGAHPLNSTAEKIITVTKTGTYTLYSNNVTKAIIGAGFQYKGGTYPGTGGTCPTANPNVEVFIGSCTIVLTFIPTTLSSFSGQQKLSYYNGYTNYDSVMSLTGIGKAKITFGQNTYDFGQVIQTTNSEKVVTLTNPGSIIFTNLSATALSAPYAYKDGSYPGTGGTCTTTLASNQSCTLVIVFSPTTTGVQTQSLSFSYNDGHISNAEASANLQGEGLAQAIISISDSNPYNFGTVNVNGVINKTFILTNAGSVAGTNLSFSFTSVFNYRNGLFPGTGGTCTTTINAGSTCSIVVSFTPNAANTFIGNMTLNYDDGLRTQTEAKELRGTGSATLKKNYYLSLIPLKKFPAIYLESFNSQKDLSIDNLDLSTFLKSRYVYVAKNSSTRKNVYKIYNNFDPEYLQGPSPLVLNNGGVKTLLSGIYKFKDVDWELIGYTLYSLQNGQTLEQWCE